MAEKAPRPNWRIEHFGTLDSTQDELRRRLEAGAKMDGVVIRADIQTRGKGRRESEWLSGLGGSYQSLALHEASGVSPGGYLPLAVAVAIAEAFRGRGVEIAVKWPNDLHLWERAALLGPMARLPGKIGGVLCEFSRGHLLVGVGINVRNEVPEGAAALPEFEPEAVSDLVLEAIAEEVTIFDPRLPDRFARCDPLSGRRVRVSVGETEMVGRAAGITDGGCLQLVTGNGPTEICSGRIVEIDAAVKR